MNISTDVAPLALACRLRPGRLPNATLSPSLSAAALSELQQETHLLFDATTTNFNRHLSSIADFIDDVRAIDAAFGKALRRA